jgi:hypothetical protein
MTFHHAILDGWSDSSVIAELMQHYLYVIGKAEREIGPAPRATFRDYVGLEREALASEESRSYWRMAGRGCGVRGRHARVSEEVVEGLVRLSRREEVPLKSVMLSAHVRVVGMVSGMADVVTGVVSHGRPEGEDGERVVGLLEGAGEGGVERRARDAGAP